MDEETDIKALPSVESEAARWASIIPKASCRLARTESLWYYRQYQGGESYTLIDWRQSSRGDQLLVREHDTVKQMPIILWTSHDEDTRDSQILLLALARLLITKERKISWLCPRTIPSSKIDNIEDQRLLAEKEATNHYLQNKQLPIHPACLIIAAPFAKNGEIWRKRLKSFAKEGSNGILIDTSHPSLPRHSGLYKRAQNLNWPVFLHKQEENIQLLLPDIMKSALEITL